MSNEAPNAKPRLAGRGFARSMRRFCIIYSYSIGPAGVNFYVPLLPFALDGARRGAALFWGGQS